VLINLVVILGATLLERFVAVPGGR
jgi:hypothetical protein